MNQQQDRQYQIDHIDSIFNHLAIYDSVLGQQPTGGGKTVEFALISKRWNKEYRTPVLILVHRIELLEQAADKVRKIAGIEPCLITRETQDWKLARVYIGMVESTLKRLRAFDKPGLVIIDEAHDGGFKRAHEVFEYAKILGFTATAQSASKKDPLKNYYQEIVPGLQINELIGMGFLAQNITKCPKNVVDQTKLEINRRTGDFDEGRMAMEYSKSTHISNVVKKYYEECMGEKTIVFNVNIEHSKEVNRCFNFASFSAKHVDGKSKDRNEIMEWFHDTEDAILNNVLIANVGLDEPDIRNVILNFSTLSLTKFLQCCGRGGRPMTDEIIANYLQKIYNYKLSPKTHFRIIDMGGNAIRFGDWNDDRDWSHIFHNPDEPSSGGVAPVKVCPVCEGLVHASLSICPLLNRTGDICGHEFEKKKKKVDEEVGELVLITQNIDIDEIVRRSTKKYDLYPMFKLAEEPVRRLFELHPEPSEKLLATAFTEYYKLCVQWWKDYMADKDGNISDITYSDWHIIRAKNHFDMITNSRQLSI